jgi:hypothetical protein
MAGYRLSVDHLEAVEAGVEEMGGERVSDLTYDMKIINKNPVWKLAFKLSELENDNAPIGWSRYIPRAEKLLNEEDPAHG